MQKDISTLMGQFDNSKDKSERITILQTGNKRIAEESKVISNQVEVEIKELLAAKESALKIQALLSLYEARLKKNDLSHLRLADEVTLKNLLRSKLQREMQYRYEVRNFQ